MRNLILLVASCGVFTANAAELPFKVVTDATELSSLTGATVVATTLNQTNFSTAATITAQSKTSAVQTDTKRANQALSKAYTLAREVGAVPTAQAVPPATVPGDFLIAEINHNSSQAWATMSETGAPFVLTYADGKSQGQAAASWRTLYSVPGTGNRDVYVRFTVPAIRFGGRWEDAAPSLTRGRLRIDFLVNGYPAWFTEAVRWNEQNSGNGDTIRVDTFGNSIGLEGNSFGTPQAVLTNPTRVVTVKLGTYPAGKAFDLTMLYQVEGGGTTECQLNSGDMECVNISMQILWDPNTPQPTFYSKPAP
jgi:hypothetical protein